MDLVYLKDVAVAAAFQAGTLIRTKLGRVDRIERKGAIDLVTEVDREAEALIVATIRRCFNDHAILAEERGQEQGRQDRLWIVDPLDGTTNFAHGVKSCCVSIAFAVDGETLLGVVLDPFANELFVARKGGGAWRNGRTASVSHIGAMPDSLLATGFPYNIRDREVMAATMSRLRRCLAASQGIRRKGSAALDLCHVAAGRFEAFWEQNLKPWDTAAGVLMVTEAGGRVTDFDGRDYDRNGNAIVASNGKIHVPMLNLLQLKETE
ncbi:MAG: inositol monophosphatase family protein [Desulfobacterales bacterium]|nr:inositol monophosphatase family protein [Desulfobacterales bacterium]